MEKVSSLVAGVVLSEATEDEKTAAESIKSKLKMTLPEYMIPKNDQISFQYPSHQLMERLIVKQWEAFYEFFAGCDFFMVLFILLIPSGLAGIIREKIKMVQMAPIPVFLSGRYTAQQKYSCSI